MMALISTRKITASQVAKFLECKDCQSKPVIFLQYKTAKGVKKCVGMCRRHWEDLAPTVIGWSGRVRVMAMQRRTVKTIKETMEPKEVFDLIQYYNMSILQYFKPAYPVHDRAGMSLSYLTIGRVTEILEAGQYRRIYVSGFWELPENSEINRVAMLGSS